LSDDEPSFRELLLMRGKELLKDTQGSVAEVAQRCGFRDAKYFSRIFKREFGCQPSDYKRMVARAKPWR
jgi:two-component system, response regulator YesN